MKITPFIDDDLLKKIWQNTCKCFLWRNDEEPLRNELCRVLIEKGCDATLEVPYKYLWLKDEREGHEDHFPNKSEGTDIVIFNNKNSNCAQSMFFTLPLFNEYDPKFSIYNKNIDKDTKELRHILTKSSGVEVKYLKTEKRAYGKIIKEACYFCSGINTTSEQPIDGEDTERFQYLQDNQPSFHKEGQIIWDLCRAIRSLSKIGSGYFYIFILIKTPRTQENICQNCPYKQKIDLLSANIAEGIKKLISNFEGNIIRSEIKEKINLDENEKSLLRQVEFIECEVIQPNGQETKNFNFSPHIIKLQKSST